MAFKDLFKSKYKTNVWCNNCNSFSEVQIHRGITVNQFIESGACPACGCANLVIGHKQLNNFKEQPKPKVKWIIKKEQPIQKAPSYSPRPSNSPANLLPKPRQQPGAEYAERAKRAEYAERAKRRVEPDFTPRGVFGNAKDINFWTGLKREDEN